MFTICITNYTKYTVLNSFYFVFINMVASEETSEENLKDFKVDLTYAKTKIERTVFHQIDHVA